MFPKLLVTLPIEVDITYVNKTWFSAKNIDKTIKKQYVIGFYRRAGFGYPCQVIIDVLPDNEPKTIIDAVMNKIQLGSTLYAEENILPAELKEAYQLQELKPPSFAAGEVHLSNIKNAWRDLKRNIKMVHVSVSNKYLNLYCDEVAWKINNSHFTHEDRFNKLINLSAMTTHTTYKERTSKKAIE